MAIVLCKSWCQQLDNNDDGNDDDEDNDNDDGNNDDYDDNDINDDDDCNEVDYNKSCSACWEWVNERLKEWESVRVREFFKFFKNISGSQLLSDVHTFLIHFSYVYLLILFG